MLTRLLILLLIAPPMFASPAPPTLSLSIPSTLYVNEVGLFDARNSTGISTMPQSDSTPSVIIDFGDGMTCNLMACGHAYLNAGTYTVTLTGKTSNGETATTSAQIVVSSIPTGTVTALSDTGNVTTNATNLQNAINAAASANSTEQTITLPSGFVAAGPIVLPAPTGSRYISIIWASLPVLNNRRVSPPTMTNAPIITTPAGSTEVGLRTPSPVPVSPSHHYRFVGLHLKKTSDSGTPPPSLLNIGTDTGAGQLQISQLPHHFIIERCWFDGGDSDTSRLINAVRIYANYVTIKDSYLAEIRGLPSDIDAAAISISNGQGPMSFVNNFLSATGENINAAGGMAISTATISNSSTTSCTLSDVTNLERDQNIALPVGGVYSASNSTIVRSISGNNITFDPIPSAPTNGGTAKWTPVPSYIEWRRNYFFKSLRWWALHPTWNGVDYIIKNLFELKFGRYHVVDGNVLENSWAEEQFYAIALTVNSGGGDASAFTVRDIQWSNNILHNANAGFNITGNAVSGVISQRTSNFYVYNSLFRNVGINWQSTVATGVVILQRGTAPVVPDRFFFIHNTVDNGVPSNANGVITDFGSDGGATNSLWLNSVHQDCGLGFFGVNGVNPVLNINQFLTPGNATNWNKNLIVNTNGHNYPTAAVTQTANWSTGVFVSYSTGDFTLRNDSPGKNAATDGTDIGVNFPQLQAATRHSIDGNWVAGSATVRGKAQLSGKYRVGPQ